MARDSRDYPEDDDLYLIEKHAIRSREDCIHLAEMAEDCWNDTYGSVEWDGDMLRFVTGGWSGNEDIIDALRRNQLWWSVCWESVHRGGLHVFILPDENFRAD